MPNPYLFRHVLGLALILLTAACSEGPTVVSESPDPQFHHRTGHGGGPGDGGDDGGSVGPSYDLLDLGAADGHARSRAWDLIDANGALAIVGSSWGPDSGLDRPTRWSVESTGVTAGALEMPPGATWGAAMAVVSSLAAAGMTEAGATRWAPDGSATTLDAGGADWQARAHDMALVGTDEIIVGSRIGSVDGESQVEAVYWKNGALQPSLPPLVPGQRAGAYAVGADGTIAGFGHDQNLETHLVIWYDPGTGYEICDLGSGHPNAVTPSTAAGVVHVAGVSTGRDQLGMVWTVESGSCAVTTRSLDFPSELYEVNASGDAVGEGAMKGRHNAILWTAAGELLTLPSQASGRDKDDVAHSMNVDASLIVGMSGKTAVLWSRIDP